MATTTKPKAKKARSSTVRPISFLVSHSVYADWEQKSLAAGFTTVPAWVKACVEHFNRLVPGGQTEEGLIFIDQAQAAPGEISA